MAGVIGYCRVQWCALLWGLVCHVPASLRLLHALQQNQNNSVHAQLGQDIANQLNQDQQIQNQLDQQFNNNVINPINKQVTRQYTPP